MTPERDAPDDDADLDVSWLLADDDPHVAAHGRPAAAEAAADRSTGTTSAPARTGPPERDPVGRPRHAGWAAVGSAFQPVPGGPLLTRGGPDGLAATVLVDSGTPLHSVHAGVVSEVPAEEFPATLAVRRDDGIVVGYGGVVVAWRARPGQRLPAGAVLGVVQGPDPLSVDGRALLHVTVRHPESGPVDAVGWLTGLPDPGELGLSPRDSDIGVDPFLLDLRLAGHLVEGADPR